jgi:hypothetical protein
MSYCRIAYDTNEDRKLILNGYSLMTDWHDATLFETKEEALNTILNNVNTPRIQKDKLQIIEIKIEKTLVYGTNK